MSAHRFFIDSSTISPDRRVKLTGQDSLHISRVLRLKHGDVLVVSDGKGMEFHAEIEEVGKDEVTCHITSEAKVGRKTPIITIYQALPKAKKMDLIVEKLTEIGVDRIVPVVMERSIPDIKRGQGLSRAERWRKISLEASKQSQRLFLPEIDDIHEWDQALRKMREEDVLIAPWEAETDKKVSQIKVDEAERIGVVVGPEGGFESKEIKDLKKLEADTITLGSNILRTETAAIVAAALVMYQTGRI